MTTGRINQVSIHESGFKAKPTKKGAVTSRIAIEWLNLLFQIKKSIFFESADSKKRNTCSQSKRLALRNPQKTDDAFLYQLQKTKLQNCVSSFARLCETWLHRVYEYKLSSSFSVVQQPALARFAFRLDRYQLPYWRS